MTWINSLVHPAQGGAERTAGVLNWMGLMRRGRKGEAWKGQQTAVPHSQMIPQSDSVDENVSPLAEREGAGMRYCTKVAPPCWTSSAVQN